MYPSSPALLEINGLTITSNVRHQLIKSYTEPRYMQYLQRKKEVDQQDSIINSTEMLKPMSEENRQRSRTSEDL